MEKRWERDAGAVTETLLCRLGEMVLASKIFKERHQLFFGDIAAIGLGIKGQMRDGAIGIKIDIDPKFYTADIKFQVRSVVFDIHHKTTPPFVGQINIIGV